MVVVVVVVVVVLHHHHLSFIYMKKTTGKIKGHEMKRNKTKKERTHLTMMMKTTV